MNSDLEPRLLRTFCAVADELHFRRAAERLNATQSAVSQQIAELERRIGVKLFDRSRRSVRLSAAGQVFLYDAKALLERAEAAAAMAREVAHSRRGAVTMGLIGAATFETAPNLLKAVAARAPGLELRFREMSAADQLTSLRGDGAIDAGMVRSEGRASGLAFRTLLREPVICLMPVGHPLAARETIEIADLEGEPLLNLSREDDQAGHDAYLAMYRQAGFEPRIVMEISQVATILFAVASMGCLALGPAGWRVLQRDGVAYRPITSPAPHIETRLVWNPDRVSPALSLLLNLFAETSLGAGVPSGRF